MIHRTYRCLIHGGAALGHATQRHRAVTLVELTVSMAVMTVLMGGLASAIVLASRALPEDQSSLSATVDGYSATDQIAGELLCAQTFTVRTSTTVEFTVADRDPLINPGPETIRYEWSGTPGDPLNRSYNNGTAVAVVDDVQDFTLTYNTTTQSETTIEDATTWSDETEVAYFDGWTGVTATNESHVLGPGYLDSEYFEIVPPEGATEMKFTLATVSLSHAGTPPDAVTVSIHRSKGDGSYVPDSTPIGTPASIPGSSLTTTALWKDAIFSDVVVSDPNRQDYCLVIEVATTPPAYVYHYYSKSAPDNGMYQRWTEDAGSSWDPRANEINQQDLRFYVYGQFSITGTQEITVDRYFVTRVGVALRIGSGSPVDLQTQTQILNEPEVASP
ncbi:MAG: prepilin-type N-terminal cleavage/methylation domain-containing protein [Phycisphaerae bacterium]